MAERKPARRAPRSAETPGQVLQRARPDPARRTTPSTAGDRLPGVSQRSSGAHAEIRWNPAKRTAIGRSGPSGAASG